MEITIKGTAKEIADFVLLLQNQRLIREPYSNKAAIGVVTNDHNASQQCKLPKQI